jgi:hypothetical protein
MSDFARCDCAMCRAMRTSTFNDVLGPRPLPAPEPSFVRAMPGRPDVPIPRGIDMDNCYIVSTGFDESSAAYAESLRRARRTVGACSEPHCYVHDGETCARGYMDPEECPARNGGTS